MKNEGNKDKLFFRYQKINDNTKNNLKNHVLYFNDPDKFNDPFDSKRDITYRGSRKDWNNYFLRHDKDPKGIDKLIKNQMLKRKGTELLFDKTKNTSDFLNENYHRVCCFSETNSNILMWSHYAKSHQGICLCFKTKQNGNGHFLTLDSKQHILFPVEYKKAMPDKVNLLYEGNNNLLSKFMFTKYSDWEYEQEYRIILFEDIFETGYTKKFRKDDLEGIIFGLNVKPENIKEIYEIIDTHYLQKGIKVNFYRTQQIQGYFSLQVKKIDSISKYLKKLS